jgi:hypothetical protein
MIISNCKIEVFPEIVGLSVCDRMREAGGIFELKSESMRSKMQNKRIELTDADNDDAPATAEDIARANQIVKDIARHATAPRGL